MTLSYEDIFSRVLGRYTDPKEMSLDEDDLYELYAERLHKVVADAYVRDIFDTLYLDDEVQEITYTLKRSVDDQSDEDYVLQILTDGMAIQWLEPQVDSILYTAPFIGTNQEKKILDGHKNMIDRLAAMKIDQHKLIRNRGYIHNSYLDGET